MALMVTWADSWSDDHVGRLMAAARDFRSLFLKPREGQRVCFWGYTRVALALALHCPLHHVGVGELLTMKVKSLRGELDTTCKSVFGQIIRCPEWDQAEEKARVRILMGWYL